MTLVEAVELSVAGLDSDVFAAEVAAVRLLALAVSDAPHDKDLWREFRLGLKALREATKGESGVDEELKALLARLGNPGVG